MAKIMVINPNTSSDLTKHIKKVLQSVRTNATSFEVVQLDEGPEAVESSKDVDYVAPKVAAMVAKNEKNFDAFVIACFADPGLESARELSGVPVVGIMEASMLVSCALGEKFSILAINSRRAPTKWRYARSIGLHERMASVIPLNLPVAKMEGDSDELRSAIKKAAHRAKEDGAEVLILGCAALAGRAHEVEREAGLPVVDPLLVGFKLAESLATIKLSHYRRE